MDFTADLARTADADLVATVRALVDNGDIRWVSLDFNGTTALVDNRCETALLYTFNYGEDFELTDHGYDVLI
jgi:hypothetical protein